MKSIMSEYVAKTTKHIAQVSNANIVIVGDADSLLSQHEKETPVDWICKSKICAPSEKYTSYWFFCLVDVQHLIPIEI